MVEVAIATSTSPADWWEADDATLATALEVLGRIAEARKG